MLSSHIWPLILGLAYLIPVWAATFAMPLQAKLPWLSRKRIAQQYARETQYRERQIAAETEADMIVVDMFLVDMSLIDSGEPA